MGLWRISQSVTRFPLKCDTVLKPPAEAQVRGGGKLPTDTEGTNRIIKAVKRQGFGYTNPENYRTRVLYRCA